MMLLSYQKHNIFLVFNLTICIIDILTSGAAAEDIDVDSIILEYRIVGGKAVDIREVPYQVSVQKHHEHWCGGSVLAPDLVLTAAHCVYRFAPSEFQVRAGSSYNNTGGVLVNVSRIAVHPAFSKAAQLDSDVALIWLAERLEYGDMIQEVTLAAEGDELEEGTLVLVTGWGALQEGGSFPRSSLQKVVVPIVSASLCQSDYSTGEMKITSTMLCAGYDKGGKDSCQADSGGPLVHRGVQHGVVSWGEGCARPHLPGVYAKVAALRGWIDDTKAANNDLTTNSYTSTVL